MYALGYQMLGGYLSLLLARPIFANAVGESLSALSPKTHIEPLAVSASSAGGDRRVFYRSIREWTNDIGAQHSILRRSGDGPEDQKPRSRPDSAVQSGSSFTSSGSEEIHGEGRRPPITVRPWDVPAFQQGSSTREQQSPGRAQQSPGRGQQSPGRLGTPRLPALRLPLGTQSSAEQRRGQEAARHAPPPMHDWLEATTTHAWLRMRSADPRVHISRAEFAEMVRHRASRIGMSVGGEIRGSSTHEAQQINARIRELEGARGTIDGWIRASLLHYMRSVRPENFGMRGEVPNLEALRKHNDELSHQVRSSGHIR